jgi:hypothetical protein
VVVGGVGEATNATGLPTAARRSTQRFGDLTFGISLVQRSNDSLNVCNNGLLLITTTEADPVYETSYNFKHNQDKLIHEYLILFDVWNLRAHGMKEKIFGIGVVVKVPICIHFLLRLGYVIGL